MMDFIPSMKKINYSMKSNRKLLMKKVCFLKIYPRDKFIKCICVLVKWITEQDIHYNLYLQHLQNNSVECPVCKTGNLIKTSATTILCDVCHTSIQTFLEIDALKTNLENTAAEHSRFCQSAIECIVFPTPCDNSMFMLCNICQFLFQIS